MIEHCLSKLQKAKKFTADSFIMCDDLNGMFTITGESSIHHVNFGMASGQPSCTCGDWSKSHFPYVTRSAKINQVRANYT